MAYTHLLLDLDGTLFDFEAAQQNAFYQAMAQLNIPADESMLNRYDKINESMWKMLEQGRISKSELLYKRFELFFAEYGFSQDARKTNELYLAGLASSAMLLKGALETLQILYQRYVLAAVTNGVAWSQKNRLKQSGLDIFFDKVFISEELGCEKPDVRFFEHVFACYPDTQKQNMLMIGDSLSADIKGGLNAQIDTCWINPQGKELSGIVPKYMIATIGGLIPLLLGEENNCEYEGFSAATV